MPKSVVSLPCPKIKSIRTQFQRWKRKRYVRREEEKRNVRREEEKNVRKKCKEGKETKVIFILRPFKSAGVLSNPIHCNSFLPFEREKKERNQRTTEREREGEEREEKKRSLAEFSGGSFLLSPSLSLFLT